MGQVVEFPFPVPEDDMFMHVQLARLFAAWRQERHLTRQLPTLHAFAPRRLGRLMRFSAIVEDCGRAENALPFERAMRWRLAGSALCQMEGAELAGREAFDNWQHFEQATMRRLLGQALEAEQAFLARLRLQALQDSGLGDKVEMLALPLLDAARQGNVVLLVFLPGDDAADSLLLPALHSARLLSLRTLASEPACAAAVARKAEEHPSAKVLPLFDGERQPA